MSLSLALHKNAISIKIALHKKEILARGTFQQISRPNYILLGLMLKLASIPKHISADSKRSTLQLSRQWKETIYT